MHNKVVRHTDSEASFAAWFVSIYSLREIPLLEIINRPFSYSEKESQSNDILLQFVEFSNVHNSDRSSNATRSIELRV